VNCDYSISTFVCDLTLNLCVAKKMIELNNGIGDGVENGIELGVDSFCKRSLNVGGVSGGHDVPSITFCRLFRAFQVACPDL
jgi:hypothetical protein